MVFEIGMVIQEIVFISKDYGSDVIEFVVFKVGVQCEGNVKVIVEQKQVFNIKIVIVFDVFGDVIEGNVGEFLKLFFGIVVGYVEVDVCLVCVCGFLFKYVNVMLDGNLFVNVVFFNIVIGC